MGDVIPIGGENKETFTYSINSDAFMVSSNKKPFDLGIGPRGPVVILEDRAVHFSRKDLASILWAAAYALDSEKRWASDEYPAVNYDD